MKRRLPLESFSNMEKIGITTKARSHEEDQINRTAFYIFVPSWLMNPNRSTLVD